MATYASLCLYSRCPSKCHTLQVILILLSAFATNLAIGLIYTYGNLQPYIVSFIRANSHPSDLRYTDSTYLYSCQYAVFAIGFTIGGLIEIKLGIRMTVVTGGFLTTLGLLLSSFTIQYSFWLLFVTFGMMYSLGIGIAYQASVISVIVWVRKRTGMALGFATSAIGFGGVVFNTLQTGFLNTMNEFPDLSPYTERPDEKYFSQDDIIGKVPYIFLIEGLIIFAVTCLGTPIFLVNPLPEKNTQETSLAITKGSMQNSIQKISIFRQLRVMKTMDFYLQWMTVFLCVTSFGVTAALYKTYGIEVLKVSDFHLTALGIAGGISSSIGRVMFGFLAEFAGYKVAYAVQSGLAATLYLTLYVSSTGWSVTYFIWVSTIFMTYGGFSTLYNISIVKKFGQSHFSVTCAVLGATSQIIGSITYGIISDYCVILFGWSGTFLFIGGLSSFQMLCVLLYSEKPYNSKKYIRSPSKLIEIILMN